MRRDLGELVFDVVLAVLEREPAALVFLHDADLDAPDLRHLLALHLRDDARVARIVAGLKSQTMPR